jgi:myo-inositol-1(or 4)-monophosphatase
MIHSADITVMIRAARKAAKGMLRDFGEVTELQVSRKGTMDFVTQSDLRAEKLLHEELSRARPRFGLLMEEGGEVEGQDGEHRWVIDPIDGTTNFIHAIPYFCISLALEKKRPNGSWTTIAAVIYDPIRDEVFSAEAGKGALVNDRRMQVSSRTSFDAALLVTHSLKHDAANFADSRRYFERMMSRSKGIRMLGATALDLAYIAAGRYDAGWYSYFKRWDIAAGLLLVKEAGGIVTQINGDDDLSNPATLLAGNPKMHGLVAKELR